MTTTWAARTALRSCVRRHQGRDWRGDLSERSIAQLTEDVLVGRPAGPDDHHGKHGRAPLLPCWNARQPLLVSLLRLLRMYRRVGSIVDHGTSLQRMESFQHALCNTRGGGCTDQNDEGRVERHLLSEARNTRGLPATLPLLLLGRTRRSRP
ncbi:hypothetical protein E2C01_040522 [Portunus trituberculatus]|uniref:Uncharacterized protein n=1 Tax=Portunus trituberculatus TaxID=210409 RepID=A0A5B7FMR4_PORTR|nr:hypothetical protein [Portunus trituberculatus]